MSKKKPSKAAAPMNLTIETLPENSDERAIAETIRTVVQAEGWPVDVATKHVRMFLTRGGGAVNGMTWSRAVAAARGSLTPPPKERGSKP